MWVIGRESFSLFFIGTDFYDGDEDKNVGDEDNEKGICKINFSWYKEGSLFDISVRIG